jgi:hypothetical protein
VKSRLLARGAGQMAAAEMQQQLVAQLDAILLKELEADVIRGSGKIPDDVVHFITRARAAIHRVAGRPSVYVNQCEEIMQNNNIQTKTKAVYLLGVITALRSDINAGYLQSHTELVHGELFADLLEMSQHLLDQGYKNAAAVIAGSSLEAHLRQLCQKSEIETETEGGAPKKADLLNAELTKANIYSKGDQKNVTAWLDLRNKAAHGHYDQHEAGQVGLLISGIRDFITRHPA